MRDWNCWWRGGGRRTGGWFLPLSLYPHPPFYIVYLASYVFLDPPLTSPEPGPPLALAQWKLGQLVLEMSGSHTPQLSYLCTPYGSSGQNSWAGSTLIHNCTLLSIGNGIVYLKNIFYRFCLLPLWTCFLKFSKWTLHQQAFPECLLPQLPRAAKVSICAKKAMQETGHPAFPNPVRGLLEEAWERGGAKPTNDMVLLCTHHLSSEKQGQEPSPYFTQALSDSTNFQTLHWCHQNKTFRLTLN